MIRRLSHSLDSFAPWYTAGVLFTSLWLVLSSPTRARAAVPDESSAAGLHVPHGLPCVTHESLAAQVRGWLGGGAVDSDLVITVDEGMRGDAAYVSYTVERRGTRVATRTLAPAPNECSAREAMLALALALALRANLAHELSLVPKVERPARETGFRARVAFGGSAGLLVANGWSGGAQLTLVGARGIAAEAAVVYRRARSVPIGGGHVSMSLPALALHACFQSVPLGRLSGSMCVGGEAGMVRLDGHAYLRGTTRRVGYAAASAILGLAARLTDRIGLELRLAGLALLTPISAETRDAQGGLHDRSLGPLGAELTVGPSYSFSSW